MSTDFDENAMRLTDIEQRRKFFYAEGQAGMYDATIDLVVPQYRLMHETLFDLLRYHFRVEEDENVKRADIRGTVLDIGSGSGTECLRILHEFPNLHVVALDLCRPIQNVLERNFAAQFPHWQFKDHITPIVGDFLDEAGDPEALRAVLPPEQRDAGFVAVVTALTLHHLSSSDKREAYRRAFTVLSSGGILLNGDLFNYNYPQEKARRGTAQPPRGLFASSELTDYANRFDLQWIDRCFRDPNHVQSSGGPSANAIQEALQMPEERRRILGQAWTEHYNRDNWLDSQEWQIQVLREVGFRSAGSPFRFWQVGLLWGLK